MDKLDELSITGVNVKISLRGVHLPFLNLNEGKLELHESTIAGLMKSNGYLLLDKVTAKTVDSYGALLCVSSNISTDIVKVMEGMLVAYKSSFDEISLFRCKCSLDCCTVEKNVVYRHPKYWPFSISKFFRGQERLSVDGDTVIKGDVIFEQGGGEVILSHEARIEGEVIGAQVWRRPEGSKSFPY